MRNKRYFYMGTLALAVSVALGTTVWTSAIHAGPNKQAKAPKYQVDPFWPKPLPDNWVTGEVAGTCIDSKDHLFIVTRGFQTGGLVSPEGVAGLPTKSQASPPVIEFDKQGNVVNSWGDPSLNTGTQGTLAAGTNKVLPNGIHGCFVDYQDNLWIGGNGDGVVQKYTHDGKFLMQIGVKGVCDNPPANTCGNSGANPDANKSTTMLNEPADIAVDPSNGDVYIADGYGNHRVVVFDKDGKYLRQWGGVGSGPGQFAPGDGGHPHCVVLSQDNLVYVCDRGQDRIEVFDKQGVLQKIIPVVPGTGTPGLGTAGSAWDVDFSPDKQQSLMFEADGGNEVLWIFDRALAVILDGFGRPGHMAGDFTFLHSVNTDSKGNVYTGETIGGRRVQKFVPTKGNGGDDQGDND
jgi:hypothetical protein